MKIYSAQLGPNPQALRNIVALKGLDIEVENIDMMAGANRSTAFLKINPAGQLPCLQLDDGSVIGEVAAIAEYLEEIKPDPVLCGATAADRAVTRMRMRQCDYLVLGPMMAGYRHSEGVDFFKNRMRIMAEYGPPSKLIAADGLAWLDKMMQGQSYICGERLTYVDAAMFPLVSFLAKFSQPIDPDLENIHGYLARLSQHEIIGHRE